MYMYICFMYISYMFYGVCKNKICKIYLHMYYIQMQYRNTITFLAVGINNMTVAVCFSVWNSFCFSFFVLRCFYLALFHLVFVFDISWLLLVRSAAFSCIHCSFYAHVRLNSVCKFIWLFVCLQVCIESFFWFTFCQ